VVVVATTVVDVVGVVGVVAVVVVVVELVVDVMTVLDVVTVLEVVVVLGRVVEVVVDLKCPNALPLPFPATAVTAVVRMRPTIRTVWCLTSVVSSRRLGGVFNMCAGHLGTAE